jgi:hypothetical protein
MRLRARLRAPRCSLVKRVGISIRRFANTREWKRTTIIDHNAQRVPFRQEAHVAYISLAASTLYLGSKVALANHLLAFYRYRAAIREPFLLWKAGPRACHRLGKRKEDLF